MISMVIWGEDYEQDIRPLIKSFYPQAEFTVAKGGWKGAEVLDAACFERELLKMPEQAQADYMFYLKKTEGYFSVRTAQKRQTGAFFCEASLQLRRRYKNCLLRSLYRVLQEITGKSLPWGIMTGVRPVKQVLEKLERGEKEEEILRFMQEEYCCTPEKTEISLEVAKREHKILSSMDYQNGYSVYIGIPFCPSTCYYCSFPSYPVAVYKDWIEDYLKALEKEIQYAGNALPEKKLQTLYIGGGTPTTLTVQQLDRLLFSIENHFDMSGLLEATVEAGRPDSITPEKLAVIRAHGISRISINPQTMKQETLDLIGRRHTPEQIKEAFWMAREKGFEDINMDIILGLAKETPEDAAFTLQQLKELSPESLTVHTLAVKRAARLRTSKEEYADFAAKGVQEMLQLARRFAKENDYYPYYLYRQKNMTENLENIGYSRTGKEGLYNILIMEERQTILALGAGATSKFVFRQDLPKLPGRLAELGRVENVKGLKDYIERVDEMIERKRQFLEQYGNRL